MVPEIPVGAAGAFDVGAHGNKSTTGLQAAADLIKCAAESGFVRQVFEKIACKNDIKGGVLDLPGLGTILREELDFGCQKLWRIGVQVHPKFPGGFDLVDELAISTAEFKDGGIFRNQVLKKITDENSPNRFSIFQVRRETLCINSLEVGIGVRLICLHEVVRVRLYDNHHRKSIFRARHTGR